MPRTCYQAEHQWWLMKLIIHCVWINLVFLNKLIPTLPKSLADHKDLPDKYKLTLNGTNFLSSPIEMFSKYIMMASLIGLTILADSKKWWCDGTFKTSPKFYYQHYIIHGKFKNSWPLPAVFSFLSGKTFELYNIMLTQLKFSASEQNLVLNPETISCYFEKRAIKALKFHFPSDKINVNKVSELGLKTIFGKNKDFKLWIRKLMSLHSCYWIIIIIIIRAQKIGPVAFSS